MRTSLPRRVASVAATLGLFSLGPAGAGAAPAQAAVSDCPPGYLCAWKYDNGTGSMFKTKTNKATLGTWDNKIRLVINRSSLIPVVQERDGDAPTRRRWMLARRSISNPDEIAYYRASAPLDATLADLARIAGCRWKIEECFQSAKNEWPRSAVSWQPALHPGTAATTP